MAVSTSEYPKFTTPSGIVIAQTDVVKVLNKGSFLIPALDVDEKTDFENVLAYSRLIRRTKVCAIHCFDGRDFWRDLWRELLLHIPADELMRISLAGAATSPKRFMEYLARYEDIIDSDEMLYPIFTHDPCGRYQNVAWHLIQAHGWNICTGFGEQGRRAFNLHFHLCPDGGLQPILFDPFKVIKSNPTAKKIVEAAMTWKGVHPKEGGLEYITDLTLCSTSLALGYPPRIEDKRLVLCEVDHGEIWNSIVIAQALNRGEPVQIRTSRLYYNQL